jgi:alkylation response protein AidB-like acyl-CoA dehydrogenase
MEVSFNSIIDDNALELIREEAFAAEQQGALRGPVLDLIYRQHWLQVLVPARCGGSEWPLPRVVALFEHLAYADANVGWCVNLGAGANMFAGYLPDESAREIFRSPKTWCAGSGAISGHAKKCAGGYIVSGFWKYASGSAHASHFTANCFLWDEQDQAIMENGEQGFRSFIFPADQGALKSTWNVTGLKATSSHDFSASGIFVSEAHVFSLSGSSNFACGPLYRFPFSVLAVVNMACMPTGIALHFLELLGALMKRKKPLHGKTVLSEDKKIQALVERSENTFLAARSSLFTALNKAWLSIESGGTAVESEMQDLVTCARNAAQMARNLVHELFPVCGMDILYSGSELNKIWRDMAAASQHYLLSPMYKSA